MINCDHNTLTDLNLIEDKYILIYCGDSMIDALFVKNKVTSAHIVEVFDTVQDLVDRSLNLGLKCSLKHLIKALENGAVFPNEIMDYIHSIVWNSNFINIQKMEALGYKNPNGDT